MRSSRTPATTTPRAITLGAVLALALLGGCTVAGGGERDVAPRESSALSALPAALDLEPIGRSRLCVTAGHVDALDDRTLEVDAGGMRGESRATAVGPPRSPSSTPVRVASRRRWPMASYAVR